MLQQVFHFIITIRKHIVIEVAYDYDILNISVVCAVDTLQN